jgi:polyketide synthase PksN
MKHGQLVPSLHVQELNENIDFAGTPFVIQRELVEWKRPVVSINGVMQESSRIAGISSFGAGGSNAHVVLEEYVDRRVGSPLKGSGQQRALVVLSAQDVERLRERAQQLLGALQSGELAAYRLEEVAYTLQVGREAMEHRLGLVVSTHAELQEKLGRFVSGEEEVDELYRGEVKRNKDALALFTAEEELQEAIGKWSERGNYGKLLDLWVKGLKFDWGRLYGDEKPRRVSLPTYPFARERHWVGDGQGQGRGEGARGQKPTLHPLVQENVSDLSEQRYRSVFDGEEFFFRDHIVHGQPMLPGVAYLEMARAAVELALGLQERDGTSIELTNVVWAQPVVMSRGSKIIHVGLTEAEEEIHFEIYEEAAGDGTGERVVHSEGVAVGRSEAEAEVMDIEGVLTGEIQKLDALDCYRAYEVLGLKYGEAHRALKSMKVGLDAQGRRCVVAHLELPEVVAATADSYVLHPSVLDGALHGMFGLWSAGGEAGEAGGAVGRGAALPYAVDRVLVMGRCARESYAVIRGLEGSVSALRKADIDVCDADGVLKVRLQGVSTREIRDEHRSGSLQSVAPQVQMSEEQARGAVQDEGGESLEERLERGTRNYLKRLVSKSLQVGMERLEDEVSLERYGLDSVLVLQMTRELEKGFGSLSKTLFFEHPSLKELSTYFVQTQREALLARLGLSEAKVSGGKEGEKGEKPKEAGMERSVRQTVSRRAGSRREKYAAGVPGKKHEAQDNGGIAIVGLSGRYPQARDLKAYWENLRTGRDCITEIPGSRWDQKRYFDEQKGKAGKSYSKWGGFIEGVAEFDARFFNISPLEAQFMDPQERLFLQCAYETLEDAGYTREALRGAHARVGVFVGVMYEEYQLYGAQAQVLGEAYGLGGNPSSIANRVSYFCDFSGPSLAVDTMCSSSLMAIHLACESLRRGECTAALAGGVNVSVHPNKYLVLSQTGFASSKGRCESFGEGGDGYVPGEGVGAVLLKRLEEAEEAGDRIHGVILGTSVNHGGKTNGYTVPNPQAQARVIEEALRRAGISAREVSYIEAHGTGTQLGDPIEIAGLKQAFEQATLERGFCAIGSVKSNIGHAESAAGIAGVTKVLLQMKHGQLVPSLHAERLNPHIDFAASPFVVQRDLTPWQRPVVRIQGIAQEAPRIAGVSSFGAGGSNAHMVLKEYVERRAGIGLEETPQRSRIVVLSARDGERLRERVLQLLEALRSGELGACGLEEVAYTLQVGREAMEHRLALCVRTYAELEEKLDRYLSGEEEVEELYRGEVKGGNDTLGVFVADEDLQNAVGAWIEKGKYGKLLDLWVKGLKFDWNGLYDETRPRRVSLPVYPFARERYWVGDGQDLSRAAGSRGSKAVLHPLVHENVSDLSEQRYRSVFEGTEFFLQEEVAGAGRAFPELMCLEMARAAFEHGAGAAVGSVEGVELREVRWPKRAVLGLQGLSLQLGLYAGEGVREEVRYEIFSEDAEEDGERVVYSEGVVRRAKSAAGKRVNLEGLLRGGSAGGEEYVVAEVSQPESQADEGYVLHPRLLAGVLGAVGRLLRKGVEAPGVLVPQSVEQVQITRAGEGKSYAVMREVSRGVDDWRVDVELCDETGAVWARLLGLSLRAQALKEEREKVVLLSRRWRESEALGSAGAWGARL